MKKNIFISLLLFILNYSFVNAGILYEKKVPLKFKKECFKFSAKFNFTDRNNGNFKIELNKNDTIAVRNNFLVPIIPFKNKGKILNYKTNVFKKIDFLSDNNLKTFYEFDTGLNKEIILDFKKTLVKNSFGFNFKHNSENFAPRIYISVDGNNFSEVSFSSLYDFDIKKIKIIFKPKFHNIKREKIKIKELYFFEQKNIKLIRVQNGGIITFLSGYSCEDVINLDTIRIPFSIDKNTPKVKINLKENFNFNPNIESDIDLDGIEDINDNCEKISNPLQKDSDADGKGDKCSDVDGDGILGYLDNCPTISNANQKDINQNKIGDVCEFDKDKDGIFDSLDNCINKKNAFQNDKDNDGIGDKCDNCEFYNPGQVDINNNGIGDFCEKKYEQLKLNDDDKDGIINGNDNCPKIPNKDQLDIDKDGIGDKCDNCLKFQNKNQLDYNKNGTGDICEDSDGDGISGIEDNCINISNTGQKDSDNNGIGDACEDKDGDEIWFAVDNCPSNYNPFQNDIDKDGIGDICDLKDDRILQSNKSIFLEVIIFIIIIFGILIFIMIKKINLKNEEKNITGKKKKKKKDFDFLNGESYTKKKNNN